MRGFELVTLVCLVGAMGCSRAEAREESSSWRPPSSGARDEVTPPKPSTITVQAGDGWWALANRSGVSLEDLLAANEATVDTTIHPGDEIKLPSSSSGRRPVTQGAPAAPPVVRAQPVYAAPISADYGGTMCSDGTMSSSTGRGTCSHHGGISGGRHRRH